jgi:F0F1-type ATP synthase assembly protein I
VLREAAPYLGLGTSLASTVLLSLAAGYFLDERFGTRPVWFLVGAVFGVFAAGVQYVRTVTGRRP